MLRRLLLELLPGLFSCSVFFSLTCPPLSGPALSSCLFTTLSILSYPDFFYSFFYPAESPPFLFFVIFSLAFFLTRSAAFFFLDRMPSRPFVPLSKAYLTPLARFPGRLVFREAAFPFLRRPVPFPPVARVYFP